MSPRKPPKKIPLSAFPPSLPEHTAEKPLYLYVYDAIQSTILREDEQWPAGTSLPSEQELAMLWNVSKGTVREALYHLLEDGIINKSQGKRATVCPIATFENFTFQQMISPVRTFCTIEIDHASVEFHCVSNSDWIEKKLNLKPGSVLVKGTIQYYSGKVDCATTIFFCPFSLLEKEEVRVNDEHEILNFIERKVYEKANFSQSSLCIIDEMEDNELPKLKLPLLLLEEFLYEKDSCFLFLRHYLNKDSYRIQTIRRHNDHQ